VAGFREFVTGEVLTAANVNDFLMQQSVMKFADAAARDTALGTAVGGGNALREGMVAYLDDTDEVLAYDGTAWGSLGLPLGTATPTDGQILAFGTATSTWNPTDGGALVAVKHALFTGTQTNSTAAGGNFAVTDLSITHELADPSNKLILTVSLSAASSAFNRVGVAFSDGSTLFPLGDAAGDRVQMFVGGGNISDSGTTSILERTFVTISGTTVHSPGAGSKTYTVQAINTTANTATLAINRVDNDTDTEQANRGAASFVLMEVKV